MRELGRSFGISKNFIGNMNLVYELKEICVDNIFYMINY